MCQAGLGAVRTWAIVGVAYPRGSPPVKLVLPAVSPVVSGDVVLGSVQEDQTVAVGVWNIRRMMFRDPQPPSVSALPSWSGVGRVVRREVGEGGGRFLGLMVSTSVGHGPMPDALGV